MDQLDKEKITIPEKLEFSCDDRLELLEQLKVLQKAMKKNFSTSFLEAIVTSYQSPLKKLKLMNTELNNSSERYNLLRLKNKIISKMMQVGFKINLVPEGEFLNKWAMSAPYYFF